MIDNVKKSATARMMKSAETLKDALSKLRTGRANTAMLDHLRVEYYGSQVPLNQVASVALGDSRTLTITPWEKPMIQVIEKAIMTSDLGLMPATAGNIIRVPMPALTEERRKEIIKVARQEAEAARVAVRGARRDANTELKALLKDRKVTEDEERRAQDEVQKLTDKHIADIDKILATKEAELLEV
ncbi:MAG TPA: ribosome recycling factor [Gammaproteobacteria bacterium]|nr:ribosome recycling factor [Gammaproteobacteria bacterium]HEV2331750.1 ribosome recycling factor [Gammaproteobacteria bacterium]